MAASVVIYTPGSGGKAHAESLTIGANTGDVPYAITFDQRKACYIAQAFAISTATANDHVLQLMAGSALNLRIYKISVEQGTNATAAAICNFSVFRLTTAGTGGGAVTPSKFDNGDSASGATAMTLPTAKGTEGVEVMRTVLVMRQAISATAAQPDDNWEWNQHERMKPLIVPAGTANGVAIKNLNAIAGATVQVRIEFAETSYV